VALSRLLEIRLSITWNYTVIDDEDLYKRRVGKPHFISIGVNVIGNSESGKRYTEQRAVLSPTRGSSSISRRRNPPLLYLDVALLWNNVDQEECGSDSVRSGLDDHQIQVN